MHPVSDTLLLVKSVQTVCLVARAGKTPRKVVLRAVQKLQKAAAPLAGVILNCVTRTGAADYYDYSDYADYYRNARGREVESAEKK